MSTHAPPGQTLGSALRDSEALTSLMQRMRESRARYEAVASLLPEGLRTDVRPGPLDDSAWVLLVGHAAAAAKVRQLLPDLHAALCARGWPGPAIKIKVLPRAG